MEHMLTLRVGVRWTVHLLYVGRYCILAYIPIINAGMQVHVRLAVGHIHRDTVHTAWLAVGLRSTALVCDYTSIIAQ